MKQFYVYAVCEVCTDGTEIPIYVGKGHDDTVSGYSRLAHYQGDLRRVTRGVRERLREIEEGGGSWAAAKLLDLSTELEAFAAERRFIAEFGRRNLVNCTDGGCSGWVLRPESRERMSLARRGKKLGPVSEAHRQKLVLAAQARAADPKWRQAHAQTMRGRKPAPEAARAARAALKGKPHANRATKKLQAAQLQAAQHAVLAPLAHLPVQEIFARVSAQLGFEHISALYRALHRCGLRAPKPVLADEDKKRRRLEQYRQSYRRHRAERIAKVKARSAQIAHQRLFTVGKAHQRLIREKLLVADQAWLADQEVPPPERASEFELAAEPFNAEHRDFVCRYEWLGNAGYGIKWCFTARYRGLLGGVVLLSEPYSHSSPKECLIQRGACASWTPKNVGSRLVMFAVRWMRANTHKRRFIGYADPRAGERGRIYLACNFRFEGWFRKKIATDKNRRRCSYQSLKRTSRLLPWLAKQGIALGPECLTDKGYLRWSRLPGEVAEKLRAYIRQSAEERGIKVERGWHARFGLG